MTLATIAAYAFALFVVVLIPGPGITALVARALGSSFRESLAMAIGIMLGDLVFLTAVVLGLAVVAQAFSTVFMIIKYAGAAYLAYLAYKIWTSGMLKTDTEIGPRRSIFQSLVSGLLVTLGNPKAMVFYLALVPTLIDIASITVTDYFELLAVTTVVLMAGTIPYIVLAAKAREFFRRPVALKRLNRTSATFLAGTAGYIAIR
ncbi:LysE family translocator [Rhizobium sp. LjRoot254]|uniref:LysE family translocator n=1 Tax=Rhizobium sp. LjRoot254 TaxID=3342297 RepID=UPI003ECDDE94